MNYHKNILFFSPAESEEPEASLDAEWLRIGRYEL